MSNKNDYRNSRFYKYFHQLKELIGGLEQAGVHFLFIQTPIADRIDNLSEFEKERLETWEFDFNNISDKDTEKIRTIYGKELSSEYLQEVYDGAIVVERGGIKCLADFSSRYVNVIAGCRLTLGCPKEYHNTIHVYGQCTARGTGVEDKNTIPSWLQTFVNQKYKDCYAVENHAVGCGSDLYDDMEHIKNTELMSDDIVILCTNLEIVPEYELNESNIRWYDSSVLFNRPHSYGEWFTDTTFHTNHIGNKVIAEYIYEKLEEMKYLSYETVEPLKKTLWHTDINLPDVMPEELKLYLADIKKYRVAEGENNGGIVMNCNPFTLGHQYLIKFASRQVDNLYIFVVEEDKSFFSFEDRLKLVRKGTEMIKNVIVVPSGNFILSAVTFPGYFYKEQHNNVKVDTSKDVRIFGKYIAPALSIKTRFAGEEPLDYVTRQYNQSMERILPRYGLEFYEIKRKEEDDSVISASRVRKYLENKEWDKIRSLVPDSTYEYLQKRFGEK